MQRILTANVADNLYWLGRHLERAEATLLAINEIYDLIIDIEFDAGKKFYKKLGVDLEYNNASDFLQQAILGSHTANLKNIVCAARENAIISRGFISSEAFGSIIQLSMLFTEASETNALPDYLFIDEALSLISEIWGELIRLQSRDLNYYFMRFGKNVETVDVQLRLGREKEYALIILDEIDNIISILGFEEHRMHHSESDSIEAILDSVNTKVNQLIKY